MENWDKNGFPIFVVVVVDVGGGIVVLDVAGDDGVKPSLAVNEVRPQRDLLECRRCLGNDGYDCTKPRNLLPMTTICTLDHGDVCFRTMISGYHNVVGLHHSQSYLECSCWRKRRQPAKQKKQKLSKTKNSRLLV